MMREGKRRKEMRRKERSGIVLLVMLAVMASGCNNSLYDLAAKREAPFAGVVEMRRLEGGVGLSLRWESDAGADAYIVMRSEEGRSGYGEFEEVYWGKETEYNDLAIKKEVSYMYRLDKERGKRVFMGREIVLYDQSPKRPVAGVIKAEKLDAGQSVHLSWEGDSWSEVYIIMKTEVREGGIDFGNEAVTERIEVAGKTDYTDNGIDQAKSYAYKIHKKRGDEVVEGDEITVYGKTIEGPFSGEIVAESMNDGGSVYLSWEADEWAEAYIIVKKEVRTRSGIIFEESDERIRVRGKTSYLDSAIDAGKNYAYRLDKERREAEVKEGEKITYYERTRFDPFADKIAIESVNDGMALTLSWRKDKGADTYIVMRSEEGASGYSLFEEVYSGGQLSYVDRMIKRDVSYMYRLDKAWAGEVYYGEEITAIGRSIAEPKRGEIKVERRNDGYRAYLSWEGDEWTEEYEVERSEERGGEIDFGNAEVTERSGWIRGTSYTDSGLDPWKRYGYRLNKKRGGVELTGITTILEQGRPDPEPGEINAESINGGWSVLLSWEVDEWAEEYVIMRMEVREGGDIYPELFAELERVSGKTRYIDNGIDPEKSYAYRLDKERSGSGCKRGEKITMYERTRPDPSPGKISTQVIKNGKGAILTWEEDRGADEYRIERSLNDESNVFFSPRVNGVDGFSLQSKTMAYDEDLEDDRSYLYRLGTKRSGDTEWTYGEISIFSYTRPMPFGEAPKADGFGRNGVMLEWTADEGADQYVIMRRKDPVYPSSDRIENVAYKVVGRINPPVTHYLDTEEITDGGLYEYRLRKMRNETAKDWLDMTTRMVAISVEKDEYEPNDYEEEATVLDMDRERANMYMYQYNDGVIIKDEDWYKVYIPSGQTAHVRVIYQNGNANDGYLVLHEKGKPAKYIIHNDPFLIKNTASFRQDVAFSIRPNPGRFIDGSKGSLISYSIEWVESSDN